MDSELKSALIRVASLPKLSPNHAANRDALHLVLSRQPNFSSEIIAAPGKKQP